MKILIFAVSSGSFYNKEKLKPGFVFITFSDTRETVSKVVKGFGRSGSAKLLSY